MKMTRRDAVKTLAIGTASLAVAGLGLAQDPKPAAVAVAKKPRPPALPADLVKEFVIAGHGNFAKVKEMLDKEPALLNACVDWSNGDFETALEGAGHMGNREIALYLIGKGARMNIFQAAMLGQLDLVKAMITANPSLKDSLGPHKITLKAHAEHGGEQAKQVLDYLVSL